MAPYGNNVISLKALRRNAWDLGLYSQTQACSGTEGYSKTTVLTSLTLRKLKFTEHSKNHYVSHEDQSVNVVGGNNR
jgi:hypothetical protein